MYTTDRDSFQTYQKQVMALTDKITSIFSGRTTSFLQYTHNGLHYSESKTKTFINDMILGFEEETGKKLSPTQKKFYSSFVVFAILFCDLQCNKEEWTFESIVKISRVLKKQSTDISAVDILFENLIKEYQYDCNAPQKQIDDICQAYSDISELYAGTYCPEFSENLCLMIDLYLFSKHISLYSNEENFKNAVTTLRLASRRINHIQSRFIGGNNDQ